jgi:hypothetical protein
MIKIKRRKKMRIDIKKEYEEYVKKRESSNFKVSKLKIKNEILTVYNDPTVNKNENWTDGVLFSLYLLYKYFTSPSEWRKFVEEKLQDFKDFNDLTTFHFIDNALSNYPPNRYFLPSILINLVRLSDNPEEFLLETLNSFNYDNDYVKRDIRAIIKSILTNEELESFELYLRLRGVNFDD